MDHLFYRDTRLLILTVSLIVVSGLSSFYVLPRMEDPILIERAAGVTTLFPGADAERVESLVTEKLEQGLQEIEEILELRSSSRAGISTITIELREDVFDVDTVWSKVRDKIDDVSRNFPAGVEEPEFEKMTLRAFALIVALKWERDDSPNIAILKRLTEEMEDLLRTVPGTEELELFGNPKEEIVVQIQPDQLISHGLSAAEISRQILASDAKVSAGQIRGKRGDLILEVDGELDSIARISHTPIQYGTDGLIVRLGDIATIEKGVVDPPESLAMIDGQRGIAVGVLVRQKYRIDHWTAAVESVLSEFESKLPRGISLVRVFEQNDYVQQRLSGLMNNMLLGGTAVILVILFMMGWRSAIAVSSALPLSAFMVLSGLRFLEIPIHQMSVTGLIIALGLLIDNAIVIVHDVSEKLRKGISPAKAVGRSVRHLMVPLFGSTITTALAFGPIALMPGSAGEFVGSIAISVIIAIFSSFLLAMTIVPAITAMLNRYTNAPFIDPAVTRNSLLQQTWQYGYSHPVMTQRYRRSLDFIFKYPVLGLLFGLILPVAGFIQARNLQEQFFPPADRDQFQIEVDLPAHASLKQTLAITEAMRERLLRREQVEQVQWFIGESAPVFYYNVIPTRSNSSRYAQAIIQLNTEHGTRRLIQSLQKEMDQAFPGARILVRQLEQGPPFEAPVEVRIIGPDREVLREYGDRMRTILSHVTDVIYTRADLSETLPKLNIQVDEEKARLATLDRTAIANQLNAALEGSVGGTILEGTEELPVRVRVANSDRTNPSQIASHDFLPARNKQQSDGTYAGIPLEALASLKLTPEIATIPHYNGQRLNEVQAYITAGVLPAKVLDSFRQKLQEEKFELPDGYHYEFGGETEERDAAIGHLMANVGVLFVMMVATIVLSFRSFRIAVLIGVVAFLSVGLGLGALWLFGFPFGFMAIIGTMGLIGVAINDSIVVLAAIREDESARQGDPLAVREVVVRASRHIIATSLTTMAGFAPLVIYGGGFWQPLSIAIAGGVGGATILALYFTPSAYILLMCKRENLKNEQAHRASVRLNETMPVIAS